MDAEEKPIFEKLMPYFRQRPLLFDVGANHGEYTDMMIEQMKGKQYYILCFEPNKKLFEGLLNKYKNNNRVQIMPEIVSDKKGVKPFYYFEDSHDGLSSTYLRPCFDEFEMFKSHYNSTTLDNFYDHIDFVKIDVEGAEVDVLIGADKLLSNQMISFIQVEYGYTYLDSGAKFADAIDLCGRYGYNLYSFREDKFIKEDNFVEDYHYENYIITHLSL